MMDCCALSKQKMFEALSRYPDPPAPFGSVFDLDIPSVRGIYFLHGMLGIEYVGKSDDLWKRVGGLNILRHHAVVDGDKISWLEFPEEPVLEFVECYYIWLCRPGRNFGRSDECFLRGVAKRQQGG